MMCYPPSGYIIFSFKEVKILWGPDNSNTLKSILAVNISAIIKCSWLFQLLAMNIYRKQSLRGVP